MVGDGAEKRIARIKASKGVKKGEYQTCFTYEHTHKDGTRGFDIVAIDPKTGKLRHDIFHKEIKY